MKSFRLPLFVREWKLSASRQFRRNWCLFFFHWANIQLKYNTNTSPQFKAWADALKNANKLPKMSNLKFCSGIWTISNFDSYCPYWSRAFSFHFTIENVQLQLKRLITEKWMWSLTRPTIINQRELTMNWNVVRCSHNYTRNLLSIVLPTMSMCVCVQVCIVSVLEYCYCEWNGDRRTVESEQSTNI